MSALAVALCGYTVFVIFVILLLRRRRKLRRRDIVPHVVQTPDGPWMVIGRIDERTWEGYPVDEAGVRRDQ